MRGDVDNEIDGLIKACERVLETLSEPRRKLILFLKENSTRPAVHHQGEVELGGDNER